jgi:hypothetical protein
MSSCKATDQWAPTVEPAKSGSQPTSLLAFLEAENSRLRHTVVELALDTMLLREALSSDARPWIRNSIAVAQPKI